MSEEINDKIFNFKYNQDNNDNSPFIFKDHPLQKLYIISSDDFNKGNDSIKKSTDLNEDFNFNFYSSLDDIKASSNKDIEFTLVNEDYLKKIKITENKYKEKHIFYFDIENKQFILFINQINLLEITKNEKYKLQEEAINVNESNSTNEVQNNINHISEESKKGNDLLMNSEVVNQESIEEKKALLKNLILLYENEKYFLKLIESPIQDEKDIKEYYFINFNFINAYKNNTNFNEIKNILESKKIGLNNLINIDDILNNNELSSELINKIKLLPEKFKKNLFKESNFCPNSNSKNDTKYYFEFVLVKENIFNFFYNEIEKENNLSKDNYKFKTLIGDDVVFLFDNKSKDHIFNAYTIKKENNNIELSFIFNFNEQKIFYNEVKNYIKGRGFINYIMEKNIDYHENKSADILDEDGNKIGSCNTYNRVIHDFQETKIKNCVRQNIYLLQVFNNFNNNFSKLIDINDELSNIVNNFNNKQNNGNIIRVGIVLNKDFINLYKSLLFNELKELYKLKDNKQEYEKKEKNIISSLKNNKGYTDSKALVNNIKFFNPEEIDKDKNNQQNIYNLIDIEFLKLIKKSQKFLSKIEECYFFGNNKEKYIFYPDKQILYKVEFCNNNKNNEFKLKECEIILDIKEFISHLRTLYDNDNKIFQQMKIPLKIISNVEEYYLVDKKWIKEFKNYYNYEQFINSINNNNIKYSLKNKKFPDNLKNKEYLDCDLNKNLSKDFNIPINFQLINKKCFDSILNYINDKNKMKLKLKYLYKIYIGDYKIFVQDPYFKNVFFIYLIKNIEYDLQYIVKLNNDNFKNFISKCKNDQNFEEFITNYSIDLSTSKKQLILEENLNKIGEFMNLKDNHYKISIKEPNHCLGLENIGATCYMNATIQCLCHVSKLKEYFQNKQLVDNDTYNKNCELTKEFYNLVNSLWKEPTYNKQYFTPTDFKNCISRMNPLFQGIQANDSKDLILFIYETIHDEINKKNKYH